MITYKHNHIRYFYDRSIRLWTVYALDMGGFQASEAYYYGDKKQLLAVHSNFKFVKEIKN